MKENEIVAKVQSFSVREQIHFIASFLHLLTVEIRCLIHENHSPLSDGALSTYNEIAHRCTSQISHLCLENGSGYTSEALIKMVFDYVGDATQQKRVVGAISESIEHTLAVFRPT